MKLMEMRIKKWLRTEST